MTLIPKLDALDEALKAAAPLPWIEVREKFEPGVAFVHNYRLGPIRVSGFQDHDSALAVHAVNIAPSLSRIARAAAARPWRDEYGRCMSCHAPTLANGTHHHDALNECPWYPIDAALAALEAAMKENA